MPRLPTGGVLLIALVCATRADAATCESLSATSLPTATITLAQNVASGAFTQPADGAGAAERTRLRRCRRSVAWP